MRAPNISATIVDEYTKLLENLSLSDKLDLISKLTESVKTDLKSKERSFEKAFGAFDSEKTAEEIIDEIRNSRVSNGRIESF